MTNSPSGLLVAAPRPRLLSRPPFVDSLGGEACEFAESVGLVPDPWQREVVDATLAVRSDGRWAAFESGWLVARQNGKGGCFEIIELADLFLFGARLILHSAHEFKTAQEAFLRIKGLVEGSDELSKRVARVRTSHGEEGIELKTGARLRFVARSRSSGRGFSGDRVILDEAQELPRSAMGALLPTMSARDNPQVNYAGTVPEPVNDSEHWEAIRDRGRAGGDPSLMWVEYSPEEPPEGQDYDLDDRATWAAANPAMNIRISEEAIERERASLGDEQFARERLSIWSRRKSSTVVDLKLWSALVDKKPGKVGAAAMALDVTPDRSRASVAFVGNRPDGRQHGEVLDNERGTGWVVPFIVQQRLNRPDAPVVLDATGPAGSLITELRTAGIDPVIVSGREMAQACGAFYDAVTEKQFTHFDQPHLNAALGAARWRSLGDARAWHRKDPTADISPLVAVTLAKFGVDQQASEKPKRSGKVW